MDNVRNNALDKTIYYSQTEDSSLFYEVIAHTHLNFFFVPDECTENIELTFILKQDSSLKVTAVLPPGLKRFTLKCRLEGSHARMIVRGMYVLSQEQTVIIRTEQLHVAQHTESDLLFKGVVADIAHMDFKGMINIAKTADYSNANQQNKNILVGSKAKAFSQPQLEIETNEVRCAHGSAIGQIDELQLFYISSRGISLSVAQKMLLNSFFAEILDELTPDMLSKTQGKLENICRKL